MQLQATKSAINHQILSKKKFKQDKEEEIMEDADDIYNDSSNEDILYRDDPIYCDWKFLLKKIWIKKMIEALNIIFEENTILDLGYQIS